jgi:acetamidase/formamidase
MTKMFQPTRYFNTIGSHDVQFIIKDGDTLETTTVDARGWDLHGTSAATRGNPMTGPIYVEGAEPGDTLEVVFESILPNRDWGWGRNVLAPNVVDPETTQTMSEAEIVHWFVDVAEGWAALKEPSSALSKLRLSLRPFLGCFGVAPDKGQAISTATSGSYGGNMDYRGFIAGVKVYFPVFVKGALLHLGDGHALQGDGEIAGTGIEISMDVSLTVRVHKQRTIGWPRGETATHLFCVGNARPLDQALQHATTEMLAWLRHDYALTLQEASLLLSQTVEYEVANVYNPAYSIVCKVPKVVLGQLLNREG